MIPYEDILNQTNQGAIALVINIKGSIKSAFFKKGKSVFTEFKTSPVVTEFSTLRIQFNHGTDSAKSSWSQNETGIFPSSDTVNFNCDDQDCRKLLEKGKFKLALDLLLLSDGGSLQSVIDKSKDWLCSSVIIDYVGVYDLGQGGLPEEFDGRTTDKQASNICQVVYNELGRPKSKSEIDISTIIIISLAIFLIISLVSLITMLVLVMKKRKIETAQDKFDDIYADCFVEKEHNGNPTSSVGCASFE